MNIKQKLLQLCQNSIAITYEDGCSDTPGTTKFGGAPDVPNDFVWPVFVTDTYEDEAVKPRSLSFLAQFRCEDLAKHDKDHLLPEKGLLSFFYEFGSQRWGFDPADAGCARVFWFEDTENLIRAEFPDDLPEEFRFIPKTISLRAENSYPDWEDGDYLDLGDDSELFFETRDALAKETGCADSAKFLGWATLMQGNITTECELVSRQYYLGGSWAEIPAAERKYAEEHSIEDWQLLLQLDSQGELMFGDCGLIYFYIKKEDLKARRFDRIWLVLQCG